jgi:hypothetical protein
MGHLAGGAGFEPATPGSGGLCPVLARRRERLSALCTRPDPPDVASDSKLARRLFSARDREQILS